MFSMSDMLTASTDSWGLQAEAKARVSCSLYFHAA